MAEKLRTSVCLALACASILGCGRSIYPVEGVVLLDGEPLEGATVVLEPEEKGQPAVASTRADGTFRVSTPSGNGAPPGNYLVTLTKISDRVPDTMPPFIRREGQPPTPAERAKWQRKRAADKAKEKQWVPEAYLRKSTTPLTIQVPLEDKLLIELTSETETEDAAGQK
jgi:hypothetical protein